MDNVIPFNRPLKNVSIEGLFLNMNKQTVTCLRDLKGCVEILRKRQQILTAFMIASVLFAFAACIGCALAVHKMKTTPTTATIYIDGTTQTVDIDQLPIAPLEELK